MFRMNDLYGSWFYNNHNNNGTDRGRAYKIAGVKNRELLQDCQWRNHCQHEAIRWYQAIEQASLLIDR